MREKLAIDGGKPVTDTLVPPVSVQMGDAEIEAVARVMRSGMLAQGKEVAAFEEAFAAATDATHAVAVANGTLALELAYTALLPEGADALAPTWTFIATASMLRARPARPILTDVLGDTFEIDLTDAARRATEATRLLVPVHLYGLPVDIAAAQSLAEERGFRVVYDAAQAHLATYGLDAPRGLGAFGDAVTYSFYPTKNLTTGEGGMITTRDAALADELRMLRDHGARERYLHERIGGNARMTELAAAIGRVQLERLPEATDRRRAHAERLTKRLSSLPAVRVPVEPEGRRHVYHQYTIRLDLDRLRCDRDAFLRALRAEGIGWAVHYPRPLHRQPVFEADPDVDTTPRRVADMLTRCIVCLPVHPHLTDAQVEHVADAVEKVTRAYAAE